MFRRQRPLEAHGWREGAARADGGGQPRQRGQLAPRPGQSPKAGAAEARPRREQVASRWGQRGQGEAASCRSQRGIGRSVGTSRDTVLGKRATRYLLFIFRGPAGPFPCSLWVDLFCFWLPGSPLLCRLPPGAAPGLPGARAEWLRGLGVLPDQGSNRCPLPREALCWPVGRWRGPCCIKQLTHQCPAEQSVVGRHAHAEAETREAAYRNGCEWSQRSGHPGGDRVCWEPSASKGSPEDKPHSYPGHAGGRGI